MELKVKVIKLFMMKLNEQMLAKCFRNYKGMIVIYEKVEMNAINVVKMDEKEIINTEMLNSNKAIGVDGVTEEMLK